MKMENRKLRFGFVVEKYEFPSTGLRDHELRRLPDEARIGVVCLRKPPVNFVARCKGGKSNGIVFKIKANTVFALAIMIGCWVSSHFL